MSNTSEIKEELISQNETNPTKEEDILRDSETKPELKANKTDSVDINDQNILDYDDELDNIANNKFNLKGEKPQIRTEEVDDESDGEVKSDPTDTELDDGEVPSPRFDRNSNKDIENNEQTKPLKVESEKEEEEEGEINDGEKTKKAFVPRVLCKYYQRGKCTWGRGCKFLHPGVNDTGNYSFLEFQDPNVKVYQQQPIPIASDLGDNRSSSLTLNENAQTETAWERGLRNAKEMKEKALRRKQTEGDQFADKKMNLSLKEFENEKENDERYVNVERMNIADDQEDEDLNQFTKLRRQNTENQSEQYNSKSDKSNRFEADSKYFQRSTKTKRASISPERTSKSYSNRQKADEWHDPWERSRKKSKDTSKKDRYSSSDSNSKSRSRSDSRSSYSSKSSNSYHSSTRSYSSRSNSRSPNRSSKRSKIKSADRQLKRTENVKKVTNSAKKDMTKSLKAKPLPGRQISDFSLKKAGLDSDKTDKKHGKIRSRSNSNSSNSSYESFKSNDENDSDDDNSKDSFSDNDDETAKKKSNRFKEAGKKQSIKNNLKRAAQDTKTGAEAKKQKGSNEKQPQATDKKQMIKDQLKLLESALKKKTMAK